jgi:DNA-binding CsgD family transcriptional regulator
MTWQVEAERLRAEGLSIRQIAERVGRARATVGEHFKPTRCTCGTRCGHRFTRCNQCRLTADAAARETAEDTLIRMWRSGARRREIAAATGYTVGTVDARVSVLRGQGVDLPYRRPDAYFRARMNEAA